MFCAFFTAESYHIFTAPQNGTYMIYVKVQKNEIHGVCKDEVCLVKKNTSECIREAAFKNDSGNYEAKIEAFGVNLDENSSLEIRLNCKKSDDNANLFYQIYQARI